MKFLGWLKKFGPAQNVLGPVKGQGISMYAFQKKIHTLTFQWRFNAEILQVSYVQYVAQIIQFF